ncbi:thiamine-phosphate kinase [Marivirga atlantica]|jgi:thiamine-monophosphate kinase|uniref:Thiamine-monophosphate kinase n=1 Tax=Marivirga atlantica TaxID=1548457 RepID=A0A937AJK0_9BACT|nr:thiamine-phosphate kinase [Marivirga atlantica]MBL0766689.1 thiamine-phosphate kinase [Marivirga atlantica]
MSEQQRTEVSKLGEFGLIENISKKFTNKVQSTFKGIGDDAAVLDMGSHFQLVSTDMLVEGIHFDLSYHPIQHLGYKAVAVNVSDIAAMNGIAEQITVSLALSNRFSVEAIDAFYEGVHAACEAYHVDLVGGDTTASNAGLVISVTAIGKAEKGKVAYRNGAKVNDIICVTGDLGGAYMGLQILEREKQTYLQNPEMQPELDKYQYIVGRQLKPEARLDLIHELDDLSIVPTSMIDISDGLASELHHIATQSGVGLNIHEDKLPFASAMQEAAAEFKLDTNTAVLNGGEDYELLFTISQEDFEKVKNHPDIHFIGYINEKDNGLNLVTNNGNAIQLKAQGWQHF